MKLVFTLLVFFVALSPLPAQVVAKVGHNYITYNQLFEEIEFTDDQLSFTSRRELALNRLIRNELILGYAQENGISVSELEVESYFVNQFNDHPRFTNDDGRFDYMKFDEQKKLPLIKNILSDMERELIILKTETIIKSQLEITDDKLLEKYIIENAEIDIGYGIISEEQADLPDTVNPYHAYEFYEQNKELFLDDKQLHLRFYFINFEQFKGLLEISEDDIYQRYITLEGVDFYESVKDSLRHEIQTEKVRSLAREESQKIRNQLSIGIKPDCLYLDLPPIKSDRVFNSYFSSLGVYSKTVGFPEMGVSEPIEVSSGFIVIQALNITEPQPINIEDAPDVIWEKYLADHQHQLYSQYYWDFYQQNLDSFTAPAAYVHVAVLDRNEVRVNTRVSRREQLAYYQEHLHEFIEAEESMDFEEVQGEIELLLTDLKTEAKVSELTSWIREFFGTDAFFQKSEKLEELKAYSELIFLDRYRNHSKADSLIAQHIQESPYDGYGIIESQEILVFYIVHSYFPEYLPGFDSIKHQIYPHVRVLEIKQESVDFKEFYERRKNLFYTPDSLQISGVLIYADKDYLALDEQKVRNFYLQNRDNFFQPERVSFEYIYLPDKHMGAFAQNLHESLSEHKKYFALLRHLFSARLEYEQNRFYALSELPEDWQIALSQLEDSEITIPLNYKNGWLILKKKDFLKESIIPYQSVAQEIKNSFRISRADSLSFSYSRAVFDTLTTYQQLQTFSEEKGTSAVYRDGNLIHKKYFKSDMMPADSRFPYIGYLHDFRRILLRLRVKERLSVILKVDEGYAVVFLEARKRSVLMPYEDIVDQVKEAYLMEQRTENVLNFIRKLRESIVAGDDPEKAFIFFGGWHYLENLSLTSRIPFIDYQEQILDDIINREEGEVSHIMKISENEYSFYKVLRKKRVSHGKYLSEREEFKGKIMEQRFENWLDSLRETVDIIVY